MLNCAKISIWIILWGGHSDLWPPISNPNDIVPNLKKFPDGVPDISCSQEMDRQISQAHIHKNNDDDGLWVLFDKSVYVPHLQHVKEKAWNDNLPTKW